MAEEVGFWDGTNAPTLNRLALRVMLFSSRGTRAIVVPNSVPECKPEHVGYNPKYL